MNLEHYKAMISRHLNSKDAKVEIECENGSGYVITFIVGAYGKGEEIEYSIVSDLMNEIRRDKRFKIKSENRFGETYYKVTKY